MIVFEDLNLKYEDEVSEDRFIVLGFIVKNPIYSPQNPELRRVRNMLAEYHYNVKFSESGIKF